MRRFGCVALALLFLTLVAAPAAQAEKRIALLIGNKDYKPGVGALVNPLNDVRVIGDALKVVGFEVLSPVHNARRAEMLLAIHAFAARLKTVGPNAVGFLYYSGHGIASAGENYLIPVDLDEPSTVQLSVQGVKQSEVLAILRGEASNAAHYLVLDACRNTLQGSRGGKGFIPVGQQSGVLVAFATEPGKTATDSGLGSSPYAAALAEELVRPGQNDLLMFHNVRVAVIRKTGGDQVPWTEDGIQRPQRVLFGVQSKPIVSPSPLAEGRFDGVWLINAVCPKTADGIESYTLDAIGEVIKNNFRAELGHKEKPGWFRMEGRIGTDGTSRLKVDGTVLYPKAATAGLPLGAQFSYPVIAKFEKTRGTGRRVGGRQCDFVFLKQ
jgi:Caspase domain